MPVPRSQLRMTAAELDAFLDGERTTRVGTVAPDGEPHVVPLWFVWRDGRLFVNSLRRSRRMRDIERGSRAAACVDAGEEYARLRGAVLYGVFTDATGLPELGAVRRTFGQKYWHGAEVPETRSHRWLVMEPDRIVSWDFRKIPAGRDRRIAQ